MSCFWEENRDGSEIFGREESEEEYENIGWLICVLARVLNLNFNQSFSGLRVEVNFYKSITIFLTNMKSLNIQKIRRVLKSSRGRAQFISCTRVHLTWCFLLSKWCNSIKLEDEQVFNPHANNFFFFFFSLLSYHPTSPSCFFSLFLLFFIVTVYFFFQKSNCTAATSTF